MKSPSLPDNEIKRLNALREYGVLGTPPDPQFDDLARLASQVCQAPMAAVSLMDAQWQWFKGKVGTNLPGSERRIALCDHVVSSGRMVIVDDLAADERFAGHPFVEDGPRARFYAGAPLTTKEGYVFGAICVLDTRPRSLTEEQIETLQALSRQVMSLLELHRSAKENAKLADEAQRSAKELARQVRRDALTGLPNRVMFQEAVADCFRGAAEGDMRSFGVMFLDLDRFKLVNDSLGHAAGDELLLSIAGRLEECVRTFTDNGLRLTAARLGGDEFTLLVQGIQSPEHALGMAEAVHAALAQLMNIRGHQMQMTTSIGIAVRDATHQSPGDLLRDADAAMYHAKSCGPGNSALFDASMHAAAIKRLYIENELRDAPERDELTLMYQPIVSLSTRELIGFEALVRWRRHGEMVSPIEFIPIAEETGMIVPIGRWVMREACRQMAAWSIANPSRSNLTISINVSPKQFNAPGLVDHVKDVLGHTGIAAHRVKLEITESTIMDERLNPAQMLKDLRSTGVQLSMDDFGTGYSSLSSLHRFHLNELKIDRSFINNLSDRHDAAAVVHAIVQLAHNLNMRVVAEGLELPEQVAFLQSLDADCGQGYVFAKPLTAEDAERFMHQYAAQTVAA